MNRPEYLVIHHSLTRDGGVKDWEAIRRYHIEVEGWSDIGYHFGIEKVNGSVLTVKGRDVEKEGAHTKELGMNKKSIGICVVGNFDEYPPEYSILLELTRLIWALQVNINLMSAKILGHRDVGLMAGYDWRRKGRTGRPEYKSCPGAMFPMSTLIDMVYGRIRA